MKTKEPSVSVRIGPWRGNTELVTSAAKVMRSSLFQSMLEVLKNESPHNYHLFNPTLEQRAVHQAVIEGYNQCLNNLLALGDPSDALENVQEPTFQPPE